MSSAPVKARSAWLQLFRLPNLLTVPGDPIAGYLLAVADRAVEPVPLLFSVAASLCFYGAGLLTNDLADLATDRRERPERPLPSGRVSSGAVLVVAVLLFAVGLIICHALGGPVRLIGLALVLSILLYNLGVKRYPYAGAMMMGLCRGFSLLLGAAATPNGEWYIPQVMLSFDAIVLYVASITHLAREEVTPHRLGAARWAPAFVLGAAFALLSRFHAMTDPATVMIFIGGFVFAAIVALSVGDSLEAALPSDAPRAVFVIDRELRSWLVPRLIGLLLGTILLLQAALVAAANAGEFSMVWGVMLLALWPIHRIVSRRYNES